MINTAYANLLKTILDDGDKMTTRNHETYSHIRLQPVVFDSLPLVTVRTTAWKKALREMEWFLSGNSECPNELLDWWHGQLDKYGKLTDGYSTQFRDSATTDENGDLRGFDQIKFIRNELKTHKNSRRLVMTTWNPGEMANITKANDNQNTPTCCHGVVIQFFVRNNKLHMTHYQRSADMLLGVPHNWVQYWAMLIYFAHHAYLEVGSLQWLWGDAHIYTEQSHLETAHAIIEKAEDILGQDLRMFYNPTIEEFKASDFSIIGDIPKPLVSTKPKLL
jgi:thymidylate synthase